MKTCANKNCFWARTANEIIEEGLAFSAIALIRKKGVCEEDFCFNHIPSITNEKALTHPLNDAMLHA